MNTDKKREREKKTVSLMILLFNACRLGRSEAGKMQKLMPLKSSRRDSMRSLQPIDL